MARKKKDVLRELLDELAPPKQGGRPSTSTPPQEPPKSASDQSKSPSIEDTLVEVPLPTTANKSKAAAEDAKTVEAPQAAEEEAAQEPILDARTARHVQDRVREAVEQAILEAVERARKELGPLLQTAWSAASETGAMAFSQAEARPHAFVIMPFGKKKGFDGTLIDFDAVYHDLIKPALELAGFEPFRADEKTASGDILTDMFQELLLADLAICDLSIDNANVFYELGIRHAFRKRGIVHIQSGRAYMPFDVFNVRTVPYHTGPDGKPDPAYLEKDIQTIARVCRDTWASDQEAIHSPVFNLLTGLEEPDRKALRTPLATGFWREYNEWEQRVTVAQRQKRVGDIMILTEEIRNPLIKEEAIAKAGQALSSMNRHDLALRQYRQGLELNPKNVDFRRQEAYHLSKLNRLDDAIVKLENLLREHPEDTVAMTYLGQIYTQMWVMAWRSAEDQEARTREAYETAYWLIKAIQVYLKGYYTDLNDPHPGIRALMLAVILDHLAQVFHEEDDPDVMEIRALMPALQGALRLRLGQRALEEDASYEEMASFAELSLLAQEGPKAVRRAYRRALTAARKNLFQVERSIERLEMLQAFGLYPQEVEAGLQVLRDGLQRLRKEFGAGELGETDESVGRVFIFRGHQVDVKGRSPARFPAEMVPEAQERIEALLDKFQAGAQDLAITAGAASGGDLLFIEACLQRGMKVEILLPFPESTYVQRFVSPAGSEWVERYYAVRHHPLVTLRLQEEHLGRARRGDDPEQRNNRWAVYSALGQGIERARLIVLWDGRDGPDREAQLLAHIVAEMRRLGGYVEHLNTRKFDYWQAGGKVGRALDNLAGLSVKKRAKGKGSKPPSL